MTLDPHQVGFTWPNQTSLTNPAGATISVRPYAANVANVTGASGSRNEESYRYYATDYGIFTELEIKTWVAGGIQACFDLLSAFNSLFDVEQQRDLPLSQVLADLRGRGALDMTILVNLTWLVQDGYVSIEIGQAGPLLRRLRK